MLVPAICVIFLFGLTAVHFVNLAHQQEEIGATQRKAIPAYESASTAANRLDQVVDMLNTAATTGDVDQIDAAKAVFGKLNDELDNVATLTPKQAKTSFSAKSAVADYFKIAEGISRKISTGKMDLSQATQVSQEMRSALKSAQDALEKLKENAHQDLTTTLDEINNDSRQFGIALALSVLLFGIVGTVMTLLTSRSVSRNAREITRCMSELANGKGDLTQRLPRTSQDEIGELVGQFNAFLGHLHNLIRELVSHIVSLEKVAGHLDSAVEKASISPVKKQKRWPTPPMPSEPSLAQFPQLQMEPHRRPIWRIRRRRMQKPVVSGKQCRGRLGQGRAQTQLSRGSISQGSQFMLRHSQRGAGYRICIADRSYTLTDGQTDAQGK